jgi:hypothetical protein
MAMFNLAVDICSNIPLKNKNDPEEKTSGSLKGNVKQRFKSGLFTHF